MWQLVHQIPRWLIERLANKHDVDARKFSATSHVVMLLLGHLIHARCMTEICDNASMNRSKLFMVRRATPAPRNTFSHANRTRSAALAEDLYWEVPGRVPPHRGDGRSGRHEAVHGVHNEQPRVERKDRLRTLQGEVDDRVFLQGA